MEFCDSLKLKKIFVESESIFFHEFYSQLKKYFFYPFQEDSGQKMQKTFDYQSKLPPLPLPTLEDTCKKYLDSGKQFFNSILFKNPCPNCNWIVFVCCWCIVIVLLEHPQQDLYKLYGFFVKIFPKTTSYFTLAIYLAIYLIYFVGQMIKLQIFYTL